MAWLGLAILVFVALILRRQCEDGLLSGISFNILGAAVLGLSAFVVLVSITGSARWALLAGVAGIAIGGFGLGLLWDQSGGS